MLLIIKIYLYTIKEGSEGRVVVGKRATSSMWSEVNENRFVVAGSLSKCKVVAI